MLFPLKQEHNDNIRKYDFHPNVCNSIWFGAMGELTRESNIVKNHLVHYCVIFYAFYFLST